MIRFTFAGILFMLSGLLLAQQTPANAQSEAILIKGATAHLGNGQVIENSLVGFEQGKLTLVAEANSTVDISRYKQVIEASGKHLYPGFIAVNTQLGLIEIDAVRSTRDHTEVGQFNTNIRSLIAYNTDSRVIPTVRSNGILMAQITPKGGRISGRSSIVQLDAWNWEDAAVLADDGIHLNWPTPFSRGAKAGGKNKVLNKNYSKQVEEVLTFFKEAQGYTSVRKPEQTNLKFEAMRSILDASRNVYVHAQTAKAMLDAINLLEEFNCRVAIVGGRESWKITDELKAANVPVLLASTQSLPRQREVHIDQPFKTSLQLDKAGVLFCFGHRNAWQQRNLPFQAGQAVAFGLGYEKAIQGLSLNSAKILGIDQYTGSIEVGKAATLFISKGDALDMRTCKVEKAFIDGRSINLDNKQEALYRKFKQKYGEE
ncbi:MAG: amidohydrolase family protein [Bacteroidota bacterium]